MQRICLSCKTTERASAAPLQNGAPRRELPGEAEFASGAAVLAGNGPRFSLSAMGAKGSELIVRGLRFEDAASSLFVSGSRRIPLTETPSLG
jgi:hypothetical protein